jgi:signal peptidase I
MKKFYEFNIGELVFVNSVEYGEHYVGIVTDITASNKWYKVFWNNPKTGFMLSFFNKKRLIHLIE